MQGNVLLKPVRLTFQKDFPYIYPGIYYIKKKTLWRQSVDTSPLFLRNYTLTLRCTLWEAWISLFSFSIQGFKYLPSLTYSVALQ